LGFLSGRKACDPDWFPKHVREGDQTADEFKASLHEHIGIMEMAKQQGGASKRRSKCPGIIHSNIKTFPLLALATCPL